MSYPTVIFGAPDSMPYELTTGNNALAQKGRLPLGTQIVMQDGRKFRYSLAGGTLLVVGNVISSAAIIATDRDLTAAAGAIGDRLATFTHGAATTIANYFSEGSMVVSVAPGGGDTYKIDNHLALRNATAGDLVNFAPGHALRQALTTTSRLDLVANPYGGVIQFPATTATGAPVGVAVSAIAATTGMGWLQTRGPCGVLTSGTLIVGVTVSCQSGTAGSVIAPLITTTGDGTRTYQNNIGFCQVVAATGAWSTIILTLDG